MRLRRRDENSPDGGKILVVIVAYEAERHVIDTFERHLAGTGVATWVVPRGGYFITINVLDGCAKDVVRLATEAGVALTPAGATYPFGQDPRDRNIRIAPTFPDIDTLTMAAEGVALSVLLSASTALLKQRAVQV